MKIFIILTLIDVSCNNLDGPIPKELGELKPLYFLNLLHNAFTSQIPPSMGNLTQLESFVKQQSHWEDPYATCRSYFLGSPKPSFNQLMGQIPQGKQFATFSEDSYEWNRGLCGYSLEIESTSTEP